MTKGMKMLIEDVVISIITMTILVALYVRYDRKVKRGERSWDDLDI